MIERCTSIWEPEAPADLTFQQYMGTNRNRVYWNISRLNVMWRKWLKDVLLFGSLKLRPT